MLRYCADLATSMTEKVYLTRSAARALPDSLLKRDIVVIDEPASEDDDTALLRRLCDFDDQKGLSIRFVYRRV